jgi:hypothetical protein
MRIHRFPAGRKVNSQEKSFAYIVQDVLRTLNSWQFFLRVGIKGKSAVALAKDLLRYFG